MSRNNDQISSAQLAAILAITMMAMGILTMPATLTEAVGPDALFVILGGVLVALVLAFIISKLVLRFPQDTIVEFGNTLLGRFIGTGMSLGFFMFYLFFTAIELRLFGDIMRTYLLINTPIEILMITSMLTVIYVVRCGIEPFARMAQILFPIVLVTSVVTMIPMIEDIDLSHFLPILKTPIMEIVKAIPLLLFSFLGLELTLILSNYVTDKKNITKYVSFSVLLIGFIYFTTTLVTVAVFGLVEAGHMNWPTLELFKMVDIPGAFIENIHIFSIAIWVFSILMTMVGTYLGATLTLSRIIKSSEQNYLALPLAPFIYYLALMPEGINQTMELMDMYSNYLGTLYLVLVPVGLLGLSFIKKQKGAKKSG